MLRSDRVLLAFISLLAIHERFVLSRSSKASIHQGHLWSTNNGEPSLIMGHRGEKVLMPEHTLGSYEIACIEGPDYIEPDLVMTKDEHLVCFHDLVLKNTTNIEDIPELKHLKNLTVEDDWFVLDLTLKEVKMLHVHQTEIGVRPQYFNEMFSIPTFDEFLQLIHNMSEKLNKSIGIIPEIKSPQVINTKLGKENFMEDKLINVLKAFGYPIRKDDIPNCRTIKNETITCGHVILQNFNKDSLKYLSTETDMELMMLVENDPKLLTVDALDELGNFSTYYSVWKETLYSGIEASLRYNQIEYNISEIEDAGGFIPKDQFTQIVHQKGLKLGTYTIYDSREPSTRGCAIKCEDENKTNELYYYFGSGIDAIFVENIKEAIELRMQFDYNLKLNASSSPKKLVFNYVIFLLLALNVFL